MSNHADLINVINQKLLKVGENLAKMNIEMAETLTLMRDIENNLARMGALNSFREHDRNYPPDKGRC